MAKINKFRWLRKRLRNMINRIRSCYQDCRFRFNRAFTSERTLIACVCVSQNKKTFSRDSLYFELIFLSLSLWQNNKMKIDQFNKSYVIIFNSFSLLLRALYLNKKKINKIIINLPCKTHTFGTCNPKWNNTIAVDCLNNLFFFKFSIFFFSALSYFIYALRWNAFERKWKKMMNKEKRKKRRKNWLLRGWASSYNKLRKKKKPIRNKRFWTARILMKMRKKKINK